MHIRGISKREAQPNKKKTGKRIVDIRGVGVDELLKKSSIRRLKSNDQKNKEFLEFGNSDFEFVSDFDIRIYYFNTPGCQGLIN